MAQDSDEPKEERKLEPYHYEAMIRAEVEKRMAAEKKPEPQTQPGLPPAYYESPYLAQQPQPGFPAPGQQTGSYQPQPYYQNPQQPQQYQSGPIPYQQPQPQPYPQPYYQPQPQPYYQQPPAQPVINVVVQNSSVNNNVNRNYVRGGYGRAAHGHIGCFNICYFLFIGWFLGLSWAFVGLCVLPFSRPVGDMLMKQAFFLAFLA
jgi:hypothetical protein